MIRGLGKIYLTNPNMTDWDNISEEEGKKKYSDIYMTLVSLTESGDLDEFIED